MAEAERCEVASAEEGRFPGVPRTKEKWFLCVSFGSVYLVLYSIYLNWMISPSSGSMSFFEVIV